MKGRLEWALLAMIAAQLLHAVEEFYFEFWNAFPPMRAVYGGLAGLGIAVFVLFHTILIVFGCWCFQHMRRGDLTARVAIGSWIAIQSVTLVVHVVWFVVDPRYQPGLATAPLFAATIAVAIVALKHERLQSGNES